MPKVSIIVPIYNVEKYLKECLTSIVNQTLKDIEIILIDDGSTDSSSKICDEYALSDGRIKVIHKKNEGLGKAYNVGIENASGEYIGFIESDDYAELNMFEKLYNTAKNFDADIVKSDWFSYYTQSQSNVPENSFWQFETNKIINAETCPKILSIQSTIWSAIYKRTLFEDFQIKFLETAGASYQDTSFAFKITTIAKKFILIPDNFIHYRQDNENSSVNSKSKVFAICDEYKEIERYLEERNITNQKILDRKLINQWGGYFWNLNRIAPDYKNDFIEKFAQEFCSYYKNNKILPSFMYALDLKNTNIFKSEENFQKFLIESISNKKREISLRKILSICYKKIKCILNYLTKR
jgi:glycosyltransferase involved in cell wall biosynthesis